MIFIDLLSIVSLVSSFYCNLNYLNTEKTLYFIDEDIKINASWELDYNVFSEIAYIQIQIFNNSDVKIWNSSEYTEIGFFEEIWTLKIQDLNIDFNNYTNILYIKLYFFYFHIDTTNTVSTFLETVKVKIIKRTPLCQLIGYKDHLKYGECLNITANFYENSSGNENYLINYTIDFMIYFNDLLRQQYSYTTNSSGIIDLCLSTITDLTLGQNYIIFSIMDDRIYNDTKYIYEVNVDKNHLIVDIINYNDTLNKDEDLVIKLSYYYNYNQSLKPLANYTIHLKIFDNETLTYFNEYETDKFGILTIIISQELFNYNQESQDFNIDIIFDGTYFLENRTLSFLLRIEQEINSNNTNTLQMSILSFASILVIMLIIISYIISEKKNRSNKSLTDLIIKY